MSACRLAEREEPFGNAVRVPRLGDSPVLHEADTPCRPRSYGDPVLTEVDASERLSATCWALGGTLWILHVGILNARPAGCISAGCAAAGSSVRPTEDLLWLFLLSVCALGIGMVCAPPKARGRTARKVATSLLLVGVALLVLGLITNAALSGDSPLWWLHDSDSMGRALPVLGSVAAGVAALRGQWLGHWQGVLLILSALASFGFNAQTERILFTMPLGAAWAVVGAACLLSRTGRRDRG